MPIVYNRFSRVFASTYRTSIKILHMSQRFFVHCKCKTLNGLDYDPDQATNYEYSLAQLAISYIRGNSLSVSLFGYEPFPTLSVGLFLFEPPLPWHCGWLEARGGIQFLYLPKRLMWHRWHRGSRCICCGWFRLPAWLPYTGYLSLLWRRMLLLLLM